MGKYSSALQDEIKKQQLTQSKRTAFSGRLVVHVSPDACLNGHINPSMLEELIDLMLQLENVIRPKHHTLSCEPGELSLHDLEMMSTLPYVDKIGYIPPQQQSLKTDPGSYLHGYPSRHRH
ncbi:hypothetical protein J4464_07585 [Candidatus Woesearchaeota archaeon]|nr:hypothetical protein [Candidatus Woesearchaeota archaeon]